MQSNVGEFSIRFATKNTQRLFSNRFIHCAEVFWQKSLRTIQHLHQLSIGLFGRGQQDWDQVQNWRKFFPRLTRLSNFIIQYSMLNILIQFPCHYSFTFQYLYLLKLLVSMRRRKYFFFLFSTLILRGGRRAL